MKLLAAAPVIAAASMAFCASDTTAPALPRVGLDYQAPTKTSTPSQWSALYLHTGLNQDVAASAYSLKRWPVNVGTFLGQRLELQNVGLEIPAFWGTSTGANGSKLAGLGVGAYVVMKSWVSAQVGVGGIVQTSHKAHGVAYGGLSFRTN